MGNPRLIDLPTCCRFAPVKRTPNGEYYVACFECGSTGESAGALVEAYHKFSRSREFRPEEKKPRKKRRFAS